MMSTGYPVRRERHRPGVLAGYFSCTFGVLGILTHGALIFVPLGLVCGAVGVLRGLLGGSGGGVGASLLGLVLNLVGVVVSPSLWLVIVGLLASGR